MLTLKELYERQNGKCFYCSCQMEFRKGSNGATVEHLKDKWASPKHQKIEDDSNKVAACFDCNNTRGNARNRIARTFYQQKMSSVGMKGKAASIASAQLFKLFGPVPQLLI